MRSALRKMRQKRQMLIVERIARRAWQHVQASLARPRWIVKPFLERGDRVCIFACFAADGVVAHRVTPLANAWRRAGYRIVFVVAATDPRTFEASPPWFKEGDALMVRQNHGYDFGSWADAIRALRSEWHPSIVALANDSVYGPLVGFDALIARVAMSRADVIGLTDSYDYRHHLQSYLVFYKEDAVSSSAFRRFWARSFCGERGDIIWHAELKLLDALTQGGLLVEVLYPSPIGSTENPTLTKWRDLVASGFPFVKVQLLRDNPSNADICDWKRLLESFGYDPTAVKADLGERFAFSAAGRALTQKELHA